MVEWLQYNGGDQYLSGNPDKDLMDLLVEKTRIAGHMLTFREASSDIRMFRAYHYSAHFLSFERAAAMAWQTVQQEAAVERSPDSDTDTPVTKFIPQQFIRKELFSTNASINPPEESIPTKGGGTKMPKGRRYDNSEVRAMLLNFYNATGRFPRITEAKEANGLPSWGVLTNALGPRSSWNRLIESTEEETAADDTDDIDDTTDNADAKESSATEAESTPEPVPEPIPEPEVVDSPEPTTEPEVTPAEEEKPSTQTQVGDVEVDTSCEQKDDDSVTIDLKITVPGREKPILITLTV